MESCEVSSLASQALWRPEREAEGIFRFVTVSSREIFFCGREIFVFNNHLGINGYKVKYFGFFFSSFVFVLALSPIDIVVF